MHDGEKPGRAGAGANRHAQEPGDRLPLVDPLDVDRVVEVLVGFARIEKVRLDHSTPPREAQRRWFRRAGRAPHVRWREHNAHDEHQEEGSAKGTERNRSAVEHQRTGSRPTPRDPGRGLDRSKLQTDERLAESRSLEDRGKDLVRGNGDDDEEQRPALRHVDLQRLPAEGIATEKSLVEFHEHEPERPRQRDRVDEAGPRRARIEAGAGIGSASLTWPNLWRTALPWPRERLPDRRLVRRDRRSAASASVPEGVALTVEQVVEGDPVIRWQLRLGPDGVELDRDPSTDPDIRITTDRETATEIRAGNVSAQRAFSEGNSGSAATSRH